MSKLRSIFQKVTESVAAKVIVALLVGAWGALKADALLDGRLSEAAPWIDPASSASRAGEPPSSTACPDCASMMLTAVGRLQDLCPEIPEIVLPAVPECPEVDCGEPVVRVDTASFRCPPCPDVDCGIATVRVETDPDDDRPQPEDEEGVLW